MNGEQLKRARRLKGLTQVQLAEKLGQSQAYVSLLERGLRSPSAAMAARLARVLQLPRTALPLSKNLSARPSTAARLAESLASLGYPGFAYLMRSRRLVNPAETLLRALTVDTLEPRLVEALPWLLLHFEDYDLEGLSRAARELNVQNRLGFVVALAASVAASSLEYSHRVSELNRLEAALEPFRLAREDDLGQTFNSERLRSWVRENRTRAAAHWNLMTDLATEHLSYAN